MRYINKFIIGHAIMFPVICFSEINNDFWRVKTNVYMEIEEYRGQTDAHDNKVYDKISTIGKLALTNPESKWGFFLEHRESLRNHGRNFTTSRDSYIRNRTQIGVTRQFVSTDASDISLNFTYRKESNDTHPETRSGYSNRLYRLMPAGGYQFNNRWSFDFWMNFNYYSNFHHSNHYEWETEYGVTYKHSDNIKAKLTMYYDKLWDHDWNNRFEQSQIRAHLPIKINSDWRISPYLRYYLAENIYDETRFLRQKVTDGYRVGTKIEYNITPKLALWADAAFEPTKWKHPKNNMLTSGQNNKQTLYHGQIGIKYQWQ